MHAKSPTGLSLVYKNIFENKSLADYHQNMSLVDYHYVLVFEINRSWSADSKFISGWLLCDIMEGAMPRDGQCMIHRSTDQSRTKHICQVFNIFLQEGKSPVKIKFFLILSFIFCSTTKYGVQNYKSSGKWPILRLLY